MLINGPCTKSEGLGAENDFEVDDAVLVHELPQLRGEEGREKERVLAGFCSRAAKDEASCVYPAVNDFDDLNIVS